MTSGFNFGNNKFTETNKLLKASVTGFQVGESSATGAVFAGLVVANSGLSGSLTGNYLKSNSADISYLTTKLGDASSMSGSGTVPAIAGVVTINTTACKPLSIVMIASTNDAGSGGPAFNLYVNNLGTGSFDVTGVNLGIDATFNWFIINPT
jgi:hypothetical protein